MACFIDLKDWLFEVVFEFVEIWQYFTIYCKHFL